MIGSNVPMVGGFKTAFMYGVQWHCECIQIYISPSRTWKVPELSRENILLFKNCIKQTNITMVIAHVPFLVNLASDNEQLRKNSLERIEMELQRANVLQVPYLILHPGSSGKSSKEIGIKRIIDALNSVTKKNKNNKVIILLETMSGQGTTIGGTFDELACILKTMEVKTSFGVCFDIAHVFQAGYDLRGNDGLEKILAEFEKKIGLNKLLVIHFNDSKTDLKSKRDLHACIGKGKIGLETFRLIVNHPYLSNTPKILEMPDRDNNSFNNVKLVRKMVKTEA